VLVAMPRFNHAGAAPHFPRAARHRTPAAASAAIVPAAASAAIVPNSPAANDDAATLRPSALSVSVSAVVDSSVSATTAHSRPYTTPASMDTLTNPALELQIARLQAELQSLRASVSAIPASSSDTHRAETFTPMTAIATPPTSVNTVPIPETFLNPTTVPADQQNALQVEPLPAHNPSTARCSIPVYDGSVHWNTFLVQFEDLAALLNWTTKENLVHFISSLRGKALTEYHSLPAATRRNFSALSAALATRLGTQPHNRLIAQSELKARRQGPNESITDSADDVRRLAILAYGDDDRQSTVFAREVFGKGIYDAEVRFHVAINPNSSLQDALLTAVQVTNARDTSTSRRAPFVPSRSTNCTEETSLRDTVSQAIQETLRNTLNAPSFAIAPTLSAKRSSQGAFRNPRLLDQTHPLEERPRNRNRQQHPSSDGTRKRYNCNHPGHFFKKCPHPRAQDSRKTRTTLPAS